MLHQQETLKSTERTRTTKKAVKRINSYIADGEFAAALLFSSVYVHLRLKSLLADRLQGKNDDWRTVQEGIAINFVPAVRLCHTLGLMRGYNPKNLTKLWEKRGSIAHESDLWRTNSKKDIEKIEHHCRSAIAFLELTQN